MSEESRLTVDDLRRRCAQDARELLSSWMISQGYATGHGDTIEDLLGELKGQIAERDAATQEEIRHLKKTAEWHDIFAWLNCFDKKDAKEQAACFMHTTLSGLLRGSEGQVEKALADQMLAAELRATRREHAELTRLREDITRKDAALQPFATIARNYIGGPDDYPLVWTPRVNSSVTKDNQNTFSEPAVYTGDFLRARAALSPNKERQS